MAFFGIRQSIALIDRKPDVNAVPAFLSAPLNVLRGLPYVAWIILYCAVTWGVFGALLGAVTPNLRAQMGVSFQQMGWLMAIWSAGGAVGSLLGGAIAKRFPPRRLLRAYTAAVVVALAGVLLAPSFGWLAFFMVTIATFETALFTVGHGLLAEMSDDPEQRARTISLIDVGYSLGTLVSPLMAAAVLAGQPQLARALHRVRFHGGGHGAADLAIGAICAKWLSAPTMPTPPSPGSCASRSTTAACCASRWCALVLFAGCVQRAVRMGAVFLVRELRHRGAGTTRADRAVWRWAFLWRAW